MALAGLIVVGPVLLLAVAIVVALIAAALVYAVLALVTAILLWPFRLFRPHADTPAGASAEPFETPSGGGGEADAGGRRNVRVIVHQDLRTEP